MPSLYQLRHDLPYRRIDINSSIAPHCPSSHPKKKKIQLKSIKERKSIIEQAIISKNWHRTPNDPKKNHRYQLSDFLN